MTSQDPGGARAPRWFAVTIAGVVGALALSLVSAITLSSLASGVVHGVPISRAATTQPWAVALYYAPPGGSARFLCSGSLISQQDVVTAAHCVRDFTAGDLYVQVGSNTLGRGRRIPVDGAWWNPKYSPRTFANDIAVLHLLLPAAVSKVVKLASSAKAGNGKLTLFGWGDDERGRLAVYLRAATLANLDSVGRRFYGRSFVPATMIAAGTWIPRIKRFAGACSGDSGGPLIQYAGTTPVLVGVVSYGEQRCDRAPTVFTRVSAVRKLLTTGIAAATVQAARANLAAPLLLRPPSISGAVDVGQTLTCDPGTWTSNTKRVTTAWVRADGSAVSAGPTLVVTRELTGSTIGCAVEAEAHRRTASASASRAIPPVAASVAWLDAAGAGTLHGVALAATDTGEPVGIASWCVRVDGVPLTRDLTYPAGGPLPGNDLIGAWFDGTTGCYTTWGGDLRDGYLSWELLALAPGSHVIDVTVTDDLGRATAAPAQVFVVGV